MGAYSVLCRTDEVPKSMQSKRTGNVKMREKAQSAAVLPMRLLLCETSSLDKENQNDSRAEHLPFRR